MWIRWMLTLLVASAILGRGFHCLYVDAHLPAAILAATTDQQPPLQNLSDIDPNESCCLCKGALVPPPLTASSAGLAKKLHSPLDTILAIERPTILPGPPMGRAFEQYLLGPPPLGGRALRALTHLLLI